VDRLPKAGQQVRIDAGPQQLAAIAAQLGLPRVESFAADIAVAPAGGRRYRASGEVKARVAQTCVVTLEDFAVDVAAPVDAVFADNADLPAPTRQEVERSLEDEDPPEPLDRGAIDVGALAIEFLALALDPYPRKPGAVLAESAIEVAEESPFAALAVLKGLKS
jgi:uncharacterized metal-binding protein YceD (DUF177 family)